MHEGEELHLFVRYDGRRVKMVGIRKKDVKDALRFFNEIYAESYVDESMIERVGQIEFLDPAGLSGVATPSRKAGWLLEYPEEEWARALDDEYRRPWGSVLLSWKWGEMNAAIAIDGKVCDGIGRALFFHAIGGEVPVASYAVKAGCERSPR